MSQRNWLVQCEVFYLGPWGVAVCAGVWGSGAFLPATPRIERFRSVRDRSFTRTDAPTPTSNPGGQRHMEPGTYRRLRLVPPGRRAVPSSSQPFLVTANLNSPNLSFVWIAWIWSKITRLQIFRYTWKLLEKKFVETLKPCWKREVFLRKREVCSHHFLAWEAEAKGTTPSPVLKN